MMSALLSSKKGAFAPSVVSPCCLQLTTHLTKYPWLQLGSCGLGTDFRSDLLFSSQIHGYLPMQQGSSQNGRSLLRELLPFCRNRIE